MPSEPYWIQDVGLVILPTNIPVPPSEYYKPKTSTKIILFDFDPKSVKKILTDLVIFLNFLNQNYILFTWIYERSFSDLSKYKRTISDLKKYVNENSEKQNWYQTIDFDKYPLLEMTPDPSKVNFRNLFTKYSNLSPNIPTESNLKALIDFFAYSYINKMVMSKIYNNSNLQVSNSFILVEYFIKQEIKERYRLKKCSLCKGEVRGAKKMKQLIIEYVKTKTNDNETQKVFIAILKEHYKIRNDFFHEAKFDPAHEKVNKMIEKLGRTTFSLSDEIEHAGASEMGLDIINNFLRQELIQKLDQSNSST